LESCGFGVCGVMSRGNGVIVVPGPHEGWVCVVSRGAWLSWRRSVGFESVEFGCVKSHVLAETVGSGGARKEGEATRDSEGKTRRARERNVIEWRESERENSGENSERSKKGQEVRRQ
jgi:hypothetical protein